MQRPVIYRPNQRWQIATAFVGSILIHIAAIAASQTKTELPVAPAPAADVIGVELTDPAVAEPQQTDVPSPPPPSNIDEFIVPEEQSPSIVQQKRNLPIRRPPRSQNAGFARPSSMGSTKIVAISAPRPDYPYEARRQHATGSGVALLQVDPASGSVIFVTMEQSTGNAILDAATVSAFRRWRFKPGTGSLVRTPITFTLAGAEY